jgi:3'-phosphoadenosine 5'-phosphosulfate sulfotransferase (PAPS reductase)/FAD synthetase
MLTTLNNFPPVSTTPDVDELLGTTGAVVAIGVSGGKDSCAVAIASVRHLRKIGFAGDIVLIHADLGVTEWKASLPTCQRLAEFLDVELIVTRREKGDMMDRWEQRWADNVARYAALSCVRLILPWSTPDMRFCTSEMKASPICAALVRRFPGRTILSVTGIRRQESSGRAKAPHCKPQPKLASVTRKTVGFDLHLILEWSLDDVLGYLAAQGFPLHEAYTVYGASRVSCLWCILATEADHKAAARCDDNHATGRRMVDLEIASTFGFQGTRWLGDTIADVITDQQRADLITTKARAARRIEAEKLIPGHLLYTKGWPTCVPTVAEATGLAWVRQQVAAAVGLTIECVTTGATLDRYEELMEAKRQRAA